MATRRQVSIFINGKEVANQLKTIRAEKRAINSELQQMIVGSDEYNKAAGELRRVNGILDDHRKKLKPVGGIFDKLKGGVLTFAGAAAAAFGVSEIISYGKEMVKLGVQMEVLTKKAETVFGEALPLVSREARQNAADIGLTESAYTDAAAAIGDLLIPMKFQRDEAANISTSLVNLSGALSEWTGGQRTAEEVSKILSKALLGEREELKQLGISIQEADVKARLAEKGLSKLTGVMLQQAKATATLELITEKSTDAQAAFAENSDTAIRRQAQLSAKISEVSEKLATVLLPIFSKLLTVADAFADVLLGVTGGFNSLLNPAQAATDAFYDQQTVFNDLNSELPGLLTKYEDLSSRSLESKEEQDELKKVMERIGEIVPTAVTEFGKYGEVLGISTEKARDFIEAQKLLLQQKNKKAINENADALEQYQKRLESVNAALSNRDQEGDLFKTIAEFSKTGNASLKSIKLTADEINNLRQEAQQLEVQIKNTDNAIKILQGDSDKVTGPKIKPENDDEKKGGVTQPTPDEIEAQKERAKKLAEQRRKQEEREAKALQDQYVRLQEITKEFQQQADLNKLDEDNRRLEEIRLTFQKQLDLAEELERQGIVEAAELKKELQRLMDEEIFAEKVAISEEYHDEQLALISAQIDEELDLENKKHEAAIKLAEERSAKEAELAKKAKEETIKAQKEQLENAAAAYGAYADIIGGALELVGEEFAKNTAAGKVLTLIQIGLKAAEGIAAATAAGAGQPFPLNLAAIASGIVAVTSGIASARRALSSVPQRKKGRWFSARGQDDGRVYRAQDIGLARTGLLPDHPVLINSVTGQRVLGSEAGTEYFVSHRSLQNPAVFRHVQAIENIERHRQFAGGGFTGQPSPAVATAAATPTGGIDETLMLDMIAMMARLTATLEGGIVAVINDETIIDLRKQTAKLEDASGGSLT